MMLERSRRRVCGVSRRGGGHCAVLLCFCVLLLLNHCILVQGYANRDQDEEEHSQLPSVRVDSSVQVAFAAGERIAKRSTGHNQFIQENHNSVLEESEGDDVRKSRWLLSRSRRAKPATGSDSRSSEASVSSAAKSNARRNWAKASSQLLGRNNSSDDDNSDNGGGGVVGGGSDGGK